MATERSHSDWWTPRNFLAVLRQEFAFDLDAAASADNAVCPLFITAEQDGLRTPWAGRVVWCNPPYGTGNSASIATWVQRGYEESVAQQNTVVMLLPAYTDPRYWRTYCARAHEIRFLVGRLSFLEGGRAKTTARFPSALVIWHWIAGEAFGKGPHTWYWDWRKKQSTFGEIMEVGGLPRDPAPGPASLYPDRL